MKKNNNILLEEVATLARAHQLKKEAIEKILTDLDKEEKVTSKHVGGISAVNELLKEMQEIEAKHAEVVEQIKTK